MGIPLLKGRTFSDLDSPLAPMAAVVNRSMAKQYWPNQDPIGKGFTWGGRPITVVGVVGDVHVEALDKPITPTIYNSAYQVQSGASSSAVFILRTRTGQDPARLEALSQRAIWSVDKGIPILGFSTLEQVVSGSLAIRRISLGLVGAFAVTALLLSLIGIYGVLSYAVTQRIQEMGLRLALGAKRGEVASLVVWEGVRLTLAGIFLGMAGGAVITRFLAQLLFGVRSLDPISFVAGAILFLAVASVASYLPARRASQVDPMVALRYE
jgi:putative ABC transport system permease protein